MAEDKFFYANGAEMAVTPYDVTMKFLRNGSSTSSVGSAPNTAGAPMEATPTILDTMSVSMSPSHAKTVAAAMLHLIREYEKQYGTIPLTVESAEKWRSEIATAGASK